MLVIAANSIWYAPAHAGRIEAGTFTAHDTLGSNRTPDPVVFQQPFDVPPVVVAISDSTGNNSASIRVTNITTTGFDELILEPDNWDGRHLAQPTQYIAVEPGRHILPDGTIIEAGFINMNEVQFGNGFTGGTASWRNVSFSAPLSGSPTVFHQLQSANSETRNVANQSSRPHITTVVQGTSPTGFQIAIDRSEANSGPFPSFERVGWIAIQSGQNGSFDDVNGTNVNWSTRTTSANIRGWDDGCFANSHGLTGSAAPIVIAKKNSRNNGDGGWLRYCSINGSSISLRVDEDRDQDNERNLSTAQAEAAAIIAFSQPFHANFRPSLSVTKLRTSTQDTNGGDFGTPGAIVSYLITVRNDGNAPPDEGSLVVTEELPNETDLVVTDFGAPNSGPVAFSDGSPATGLGCVFVSLASPADCLFFSTDGIDYTYAPTDSGDGTDPNVRYVQIRPSGFMSGDTGTGSPSFTLRLRARIDPVGP
ncbi:MAG: H-type lectin domain-containing protein [Pseudomonadota bacterium]|nr:H-type lectin domain-containing protein [Pseudomonadota bacterium]